MSNDAEPQLAAVMRLSDGRTMAAARIDTANGCGFGGTGDAPLLFAVYNDDGGAFFGRAAREAGAPIQWQSSWVWNGPSIWLSRFMFDDGHGVTSNNGEVDWLPSTTATSFSVLDNSISPVDYASGRGHLLVWNKNDASHGWLMWFMKDAGAPSSLVTEPSGSGINVARVTDDRVVWITVGGPRAYRFEYAWARIDWMKYVVTQGGLTTQTEPPGPSIPAPTRLSDLAAGDDYAATIGCGLPTDAGDGPCSVYVARLSTGQVWKIPPRTPNTLFVSVLAVGPTELVLGEQDSQPVYARQWFKRIVRLAIPHLDEIVASW